MAGHPTVGSTFALAHAGVIHRGQSRFAFGLNVGPTPVDLEWDGDRLRFVWMTQGTPAFGPHVSDRAAVAAAIGLGVNDLAGDLPIQEISCGVPYLIVPLRNRETVDRATPRADAILELPGVSRAHPAILLFAQEVRLTAFAKAPAVEKAGPTSTEGPPRRTAACLQRDSVSWRIRQRGARLARLAATSCSTVACLATKGGRW
jgi:predicted PhzF superfamily epimerase YddE/YHI9